MVTLRFNGSFDVAHRARIADRAIAVSAIATARAPNVLIAIHSLILVVTLVLLPGAVWMHAT